jgi:hypothetical protein
MVSLVGSGKNKYKPFGNPYYWWEIEREALLLIVCIGGLPGCMHLAAVLLGVGDRMPVVYTHRSVCLAFASVATPFDSIEQDMQRSGASCDLIRGSKCGLDPLSVSESALYVSDPGLRVMGVLRVLSTGAVCPTPEEAWAVCDGEEIFEFDVVAACAPDCGGSGSRARITLTDDGTGVTKLPESICVYLAFPLDAEGNEQVLWCRLIFKPGSAGQSHLLFGGSSSESVGKTCMK